MTSQSIELSSYISELRREIATAVELVATQGEQGVFFEMSEIELELHTVVEASADIGVKAQFRVPFFSSAAASATGSLGNIQTQKLKLKLKVTDSDGKAVKVNRSLPYKPMVEN